ncbi:MAG: hypothetical protein AAB263_13270 [Planctomycetota bacterium]
MSRLSALCIPLVLLAGCNARDTASLGNGAYSEGGIGSAFYAEVPYATEAGGKTRMYLFGTVAGFDAFMATKLVDDKKHKKVIRNGQTLVVESLLGIAAKEDPGFPDRLTSQYWSRHPAPVAAAEPAAAPAN